MATLREVKKRIKTVVSRLVFMVIVLTLLAASSSSGFDGNRKGFVLGGGLGIAPTAGWSGTGTFGAALVIIDTSEYRTGAGFNFLIGHGWDEKNLIVFEINMSRWKSDLLTIREGSGQLLLNSSIWQGYIGGAWYHYFGSVGRSLFTALGLGQYQFITLYSSTFFDQSAGTGILIGGGYEFARHWQLGAYLSTGFTAEKLGRWNYTDIKVLVSAVAF